MADIRAQEADYVIIHPERTTRNIITQVAAGVIFAVILCVALVVAIRLTP